MELSEELKILCCFFVAFLEFVLNFEHFKNKNKKERKNVSNSWSISEIIDYEEVVS